MRKIIIDLSTSSIFANASKFVELISAYHNEKYEISIIKKNWKNINFQGVKYNKEKNEYSKSTGNYIWDPGIHPDDYFENLVFPSFKLKFDKEISQLKKIFYIFKKNYISYNSCLYICSTEYERQMIEAYYFKTLKENFSFKNFLLYLLKIFEFKITKYVKFLPNKFKPFRYRLSNDKSTVDVNEFIKKHKNEKKKILISVLWDENKKFEVLNDRLKGGPIFKKGLDEDFKELLNFVKTIDDKILKGEKYQFILASKKAVDWDKFIKSEFIDLRNFEELNFSLSQMLYICQELSSYSINWPSTFSIWITNCSEINHITFHDFKDTSNWCKINLNNKEQNLLLT